MIGGKSAGAAAMSLSPRCYALSQITSLVASISRKNFKTNQAEIEKVRPVVLIDAHHTCMWDGE